MIRFYSLLFCCLILGGCLNAKKAPFDMNSPFGVFFNFLFSLQYSVGGTITGFSSGTLVLQNNAKDDLTLQPTDKYSFSQNSSGATYSISIKSHPVGFGCKIENSKGTVTGNVTNVNISCSASNTSALYTLGDSTKSYWLDYVKFDGTSPINATGATCTGSETGFYNSCIHAGEFRKVDIPNITSCDGITASDSLSAFNWKCNVATDGSVSVISTGLKDDKGLSDLIDFTSPGSFKTNAVTILLNGNSLLTSATGKWWNNSISVDNDGGNLIGTKQIFIVNDTSVFAGSTFTINQSQTAILVKPGLKRQVSGIPSVNLGNNNFSWVEGFFESTTGAAVINVGNTNKFSVIRNLKAVNTAGATTIYSNGSAGLFHNISGTNNNGSFLILTLPKNIVRRVNAFNTAGDAIEFSQADNILIDSLCISPSSIGLKFTSGSSSSNNLLMNITCANTGSVALTYTGGSSVNYQTTMNFIGTNSTNVIDNAFSNFAKFINTVAAHSSNAARYLEQAGNTQNSIFNGIFKVDTSTACTTTGATNPGVTNSTCAKTNGSETSVPTETGISLASSFVGQVSSTDSKNSSNVNGASTFPPSDWVNFENQFRAWGKQGTFPTTAASGRCSTGTCQIWDWSLSKSDTVARNVNSCPNGSTFDTHQWSDGSASSQAYCDANYKGSVLNGTTCITTFLRNAVEIFGDGVGNENGICESGEECLYTPNIGAYQGHSSDSTNPSKLIKADSTSSTNSNNCSDITTGGTITNVKLWKYDTNGY
jgi:hypothetical protein